LFHENYNDFSNVAGFMVKDKGIVELKLYPYSSRVSFDGADLVDYDFNDDASLKGDIKNSISNLVKNTYCRPVDGYGSYINFYYYDEYENLDIEIKYICNEKEFSKEFPEYKKEFKNLMGNWYYDTSLPIPMSYCVNLRFEGPEYNCTHQ